MRKWKQEEIIEKNQQRTKSYILKKSVLTKNDKQLVKEINNKHQKHEILV